MQDQQSAAFGLTICWAGELALRAHRPVHNTQKLQFLHF